jgi:hypothetical protein
MAPSFQGLPAFLAKTRYKSPSNPADGPVQFGHQTDLPLFGLLQSKPKLGQAFNSFMSGHGTDSPGWTEYYPVAQRLGVQGKRPNVEDEGVLLVDVGGGLGHVLATFHKRHPHMPGRLILQDQESVISQIPPSSLPSKITPTVHDFFTAQPVKGARAYYMHFILHDWTDEHCTKILGHLRDAMTSGYSKILINEYVVPDREATWQMTSLDWSMMAAFASRERTERQWRALLEACGLRIVGIWKKKGNRRSESIIEAVLGNE